MLQRAFFALLPDPEGRRVLQQLRRQLADDLGESSDWLLPEDWHLTLAFLADQPEALVGRSVAWLDRWARQSPLIELASSQLVVWPSQRPRVLVLELLPRPPLLALRQAAAAAAVELGRPPESPPFRPHITLRRSRALLSTGGSSVALPVVRFGELALMCRSGSPGPRYHRRLSRPLARTETAHGGSPLSADQGSSGSDR